MLFLYGWPSFLNLWYFDVNVSMIYIPFLDLLCNMCCQWREGRIFVSVQWSFFVFLKNNVTLNVTKTNGLFTDMQWSGHWKTVMLCGPLNDIERSPFRCNFIWLQLWVLLVPSYADFIDVDLFLFSFFWPSNTMNRLLCFNLSLCFLSKSSP